MNTRIATFAEVSTATFAKVFDAVSYYLPEAVINAGQRLCYNLTPLAINQLYDRTLNDNIAISYPVFPFSGSPTLIVVAGNKQNMLAVTGYGDGEKADNASRNPLHFIKEMAGTENIINMNYKNAAEQRKKIKPFLSEAKSLENAYHISTELFIHLFTHWDFNKGFNENVSHVCINIISESILGLPALSKEETAVITLANKKMRESEPGQPDFENSRQAVSKLNHDLLTTQKEKILSTQNYIHSKANGDAEKILSTYGVSNLLVESNLTMLIMTGMAYVNNTHDIRHRLVQEIESTQNMSLNEMRQLPYLDCIYKEALRFASPAPFIARETSRESNITITDNNGNKKIYNTPNHSLLFAPIRRMHHDTRYWKNPSEFRPERFEDPEAVNHLIPYSLGARSCPAAAHFNEIVFKAALIASVKYQLIFDKEFEEIPADSLSSRWQQEYFVTKINEWQSTKGLQC